MDTFRAIVRRLTVALIVLFLGVAFSPVFAAATTYSQAMALCASTWNLPANGSWSSRGRCTSIMYSGVPTVVEQVGTAASPGGYNTPPSWPWTVYDGVSPCLSVPSYPSFNFAGKVTSGMTTSMPATDPSGATVHCGYVLTVLSGGPVMNQWGNWNTLVSMIPTGNPAGGTGSDGAVFNPGGSVPNPAPPSVNPSSPPPTSATAPPQVCDGGSCYNQSTDQYCAVSGGAQSCVSGSAARSGGGSCVSSGDSALCAGSPSAPSPPASTISDPATSIKGSDTYTQANPTTGANQTVTVNTFTNPGATPLTSGQKAGDVGPSSTGGDPAGSSSSANVGSFGGGGDCNTPPVCSGDAAMCGTALEEWRAMCSAHTDAQALSTALVGDGQQPSDLSTLASKYSQSDFWPTQTPGNTQGDAANGGSYNQGGFGYSRQCPLQDLSLSSIPFVVKFSDGCTVIEYFGYFLVGLALFAAACITAGSNQ